MAEKHLVVQGAMCRCNFGTTPDKLKVATHSKEYVNDKDGSKKPIASTKDINQTFEKNNFGSCSKNNNGPCKVTVTEWKGFYEQVELMNGGKILLEDSKATCAVGGPECISILNHGQVAQLSQQNAQNTKPVIGQVLNPAVDSSALGNEPRNLDGLILS